MILGHNNWCFVHVPKTGGTWIRTVLVDRLKLGNYILGNNQPHRSPLKYELASPPVTPSWMGQVDTGDRACFAFVRHPYSWYQSMWCMSTHDHWTAHRGRWPLHAVSTPECPRPSFGEFVRWMFTLERGYLTRLYEQFCGPPGSDCVIGRYEFLYRDLIGITDGLGLDIASAIATRRVNVFSQNPEWSERCKLTSDIRELIYDSERDAFERFDYAP